MSPRAPSLPPELPGFTYVSLLGLGGFADVFKYEDSLGRQVAVKVLLRDTAGAGEASFGAEANLMAKLSNHPSIVSVHQAGIAADGRPFLVMEHCPPPHLSARLRSRPFTVSHALICGVQLAGAVETAHRLGILHRDIKPANILFTEYGRPALTDFGISVSTGIDGVGTGAGVSVAWAPPEQLVKGASTGRSGDVYSLAATVHHMLAGRSPFQRNGALNEPYELSRRVQSEPVPRVGRPDVPESLERVLATAMAKSPELRYQTALEFARALQTVQIELHQSPTTIEVRDDAAGTAADDDDDIGGTRVEGFVLIDPDGPGGTVTNAPGNLTGGPITMDAVGRTAPPPEMIHHGRGLADPVEPLEWTGHTAFDGPVPGGPAAVAPATSPEPARPRGSRSLTVRWTAIGAAVLAVAAAVVFIAIQAGGGAATQSNEGSPGQSTPSPTPADPLGGIVPAPINGSGVASGDTVAFSWTNPAPIAGDSFLYRLDDPANPVGYTMGTEPQAVVAAQPGRTCIDVILRRTGGQASEPAVFCVPPASGGVQSVSTS